MRDSFASFAFQPAEAVSSAEVLLSQGAAGTLETEANPQLEEAQAEVGAEADVEMEGAESTRGGRGSKMTAETENDGGDKAQRPSQAAPSRRKPPLRPWSDQARGISSFRPPSFPFRPASFLAARDAVGRVRALGLGA
eukprot:3983447-Pleurochrysis_carterae.AAC.1